MEHLLAERTALPRVSPWLQRFYWLEPQGTDGYMPVHMAATAMGTTVEEVAGMVNRGWLSCRAEGSSVWVRPAAVSRMR